MEEERDGARGCEGVQGVEDLRGLAGWFIHMSALTSLHWFQEQDKYLSIMGQP